MKTAFEFAKEYYNLPTSKIETVYLESAIKFAEKYANQDRWIKVSERLPELIDGKSKKIILIDGKKYRFGYYFPDHFKTVEWEDWDDYSEDDFPYTIHDREKQCVWLRAGFYIDEYCSYCDRSFFEPFKPTHWQPLPEPPKD